MNLTILLLQISKLFATVTSSTVFDFPKDSDNVITKRKNFRIVTDAFNDIFGSSPELQENIIKACVNATNFERNVMEPTTSEIDTKLDNIFANKSDELKRSFNILKLILKDKNVSITDVLNDAKKEIEHSWNKISDFITNFNNDDESSDNGIINDYAKKMKSKINDITNEIKDLSFSGSKDHNSSLINNIDSLLKKKVANSEKDKQYNIHLLNYFSKIRFILALLEFNKLVDDSNSQGTLRKIFNFFSSKDKYLKSKLDALSIELFLYFAQNDESLIKSISDNINLENITFLKNYKIIDIFESNEFLITGKLNLALMLETALEKDINNLNIKELYDFKIKIEKLKDIANNILNNKVYESEEDQKRFGDILSTADIRMESVENKLNNIVQEEKKYQHVITPVHVNEIEHVDKKEANPIKTDIILENSDSAVITTSTISNTDNKGSNIIDKKIPENVEVVITKPIISNTECEGNNAIDDSIPKATNNNKEMGEESSKNTLGAGELDTGYNKFGVYVIIALMSFLIMIPLLFKILS